MKKKVLSAVLTVLMIFGIFLAVSNFTSENLEAGAVWVELHDWWWGGTCHGPGDGCVIVTPDPSPS